MTKAETTVERVGGYRVVRRLATSATSEDLLAVGPHERPVVLKLLLSQNRNDEEFARIFTHEASAYARLSHPSIVQLLDFFSFRDEGVSGQTRSSGGREGQLVMVLEYVDGPALSRLRSMLKAVGTELDDRGAIHVAARIFAALAAAHSAVDATGAHAPVIHRDVNPSNVLVPWDGAVKLADFGVASVTGLNHPSVAGLGLVKGTYGYMAPEQVTGELVTPRADVYAGAIILWELLTKRRAFHRGALPELEALRAMAEPRLLSIDRVRPDIDKAVRDALKRALEPRPERRTITAEEMLSILSSIVIAEEGRQRLVSALTLVRNDPRAAAVAPSHAPGKVGSSPPSTVPNPITLRGGVAPPTTKTGGLPPPGLLEKLGRGTRSGAAMQAPPLPSSYVAAGPKKAPSRVGLSAVEAPKTPGPPAPSITAAARQSPGPPRAPSNMGMRATTLESSPSSSVPPKRPSASQRLAGAVPDTTRDLMPPPQVLALAAGSLGSTMSIFDAFAAPGEGVPADRETMPGDIKLKDAIDEILRGVPSSMPPDMLNETSRVPPPILGIPPPLAEPAKPASSGLGDTIPTVATVRGYGRIPAAPAPMQFAPRPKSEPPVSLPPTPPAVPPALPPRPPRGEVVPLAPPMPRIALTKTLAMESRPDSPRPHADKPPPLFSPTPSTSEATQTPLVSGDHGHRSPLLHPAAIASAPGTSLSQDLDTSRRSRRHGVVGAEPQDLDTSRRHQGVVGAEPQDFSAQIAPPPRRRAFVVGTVAAALVALIGAAIAGSVGYGRYQHSRADAVATGAGLSATASAAVPPSAPPSVIGSALPVASVVSTASASAAPAPSNAPSGEVAGDTGVLKTAGAVAGRRIFVDEKTLGQTPESITVKCGPHSVRLGSAGKPQTIVVPCGGEISVADKF